MTEDNDLDFVPALENLIARLEFELADCLSHAKPSTIAEHKEKLAAFGAVIAGLRWTIKDIEDLNGADSAPVAIDLKTYAEFGRLQ